MDITSIISWIINGLMGLAVFFIKTSYNDLKDKIGKQEDALEKVKETYTKKEDFISFKTELWMRLDEMKADFLRALDKK
jgi:hypothetical protein